MIYRTLQRLFSDSANIRDRVAVRIFAEHAPAKTVGPCIVMRIISGSPESHLEGETDCGDVVVQIDAYDETPDKAWALGELIRNRLSGYQGEVTYLANDGTEASGYINEASLKSRRMLEDAPANASDRWVCRDSADYEIFYLQSVPTLT